MCERVVPCVEQATRLCLAFYTAKIRKKTEVSKVFLENLRFSSYTPVFYTSFNASSSIVNHARLASARGRLIYNTRALAKISRALVKNSCGVFGGLVLQYNS